MHWIIYYQSLISSLVDASFSFCRSLCKLRVLLWFYWASLFGSLAAFYNVSLGHINLQWPDLDVNGIESQWQSNATKYHESSLDFYRKSLQPSHKKSRNSCYHPTQVLSLCCSLRHSIICYCLSWRQPKARLNHSRERERERAKV